MLRTPRQVHGVEDRLANELRMRNVRQGDEPNGAVEWLIEPACHLQSQGGLARAAQASQRHQAAGMRDEGYARGAGTRMRGGRLFPIPLPSSLIPWKEQLTQGHDLAFAPDEAV